MKLTEVLLRKSEKRRTAAVRRWAKENGMDPDLVDRVLARHREGKYPFLDADGCRDRILFSFNRQSYNMRAFFKGFILVSEGWMKELVRLQYSVDTCVDAEKEKAVKELEAAEDAFRLRLGHEHAHHIFGTLKWISSTDTLKAYVDEVYADVKGAALAFPDDKARAVRAMEWLAARAGKNNQRDSKFHPAYGLRLSILKNGTFDADVLEMLRERADQYMGRRNIISKTLYQRNRCEVFDQIKAAYQQREITLTGNAINSLPDLGLRQDKITMQKAKGLIEDGRVRKTENNKNLGNSQKTVGFFKLRALYR